MVTRSPTALLRNAVVSFSLSLGLGLLGLYVASPDGLLRAETYRGFTADGALLALSVATILALWSAPALRIAILCREQAFFLPMRSALAVSLSTSFGSAVTPGKSGGGGVTAIALRRLGLPLGRGISVAIHVIVLDVLFYALTVAPSLLLILRAGTFRPAPAVEALILILAAAAAGGAVALVRSPRLAAVAGLRFARWRPLARVRGRIERVMRDYYRGARAFSGMRRRTWLLLMLVTAGGWLGNYALFWALAGLFRLDLDLGGVLGGLNLVTLSANVVPTPGGSGYIEAVVGVTQPGTVTAPLLLWRGLSYLPIFVLGPMAAHWLYRRSARPNGPRGRIQRS